MERNSDLQKPSGVVFWLLVGLAVPTLAASLIVPEWRNLVALDVARQWEAHRVEQLNEQITAGQRALDAIRADPAVVARLAMRELNYRREGHDTIALGLPVSAPQDQAAFAAQPMSPPEPVSSLASRVPASVVGVFADGDLQPILIGLSASVLACAFVLFCVPALWQPPLDEEGDSLAV